MDAGYRDGQRPDVFVVPLDPNRDPLENQKPPLAWLFGRKTGYPFFHLEIGGDNIWLRAAENRDSLGDVRSGSLVFSPVAVASPTHMHRTPGWYMQHRAGMHLVATYLPELLFPSAPIAQQVVAYWLGSGDFRAIRGALYPT